MSTVDFFNSFDNLTGEDEIWAKFSELAGRHFGVSSILYGFTHNKYTAARSGITRSIYMRHNHPADYVEASGGAAFLDGDPCATLLFEAGGSFLWEDVYALGTPAGERRRRIGSDFEMEIGATLGVPFYGGQGMSGAGFSAGPMRGPEFRKIWNGKRSEIIALFAAFDARLRPAMVARTFHLSPRERDVIAYAAAGLTGKEIAHRLGLRPKSVFNTMERARRSLDAATTLEAIAKAYAFHLI